MSFPRAALHLGGLWALAFAQPLFQLLGRNAEFFVARGSTAGDILLLAFVYTLVPPLVLAAIVWGLGKLRPALGWGAMLAFVGLIVAAFVLPPVGDLLGGSALAVPVALALGAGAAYLYARVSGVRSFASLIAVAPAVVLVLFLIVSPVRGLLFPSDAGGAVAGPAQSSTPIVHVVLDELPLATLVGDRRQDRRADVPELRAARARVDLVPQRHDGRRPDGGRGARAADRLARAAERAADHERLPAQPVHAVRAQPPADGGRADHGAVPGTAVRQHAAGHLGSPDGARVRPRGRRQAAAVPGGPARGAAGDRPRVGGLRAGRARRRRGVRQRQEPPPRRARPPAQRQRDRRLGEGDRGAARARHAAASCVFLHSTLPHGPWRFLPDGKQYPSPGNGYLGPRARGLDRAAVAGRPGVPAPPAAGAVRRPAARPAARRGARRRRARRHRRPRLGVRLRRAEAADRAQQRGRDRAGAVLRQAAGPVGRARRRPRRADDGRPADARQGRRDLAAVEGAGRAGRRARGRPGRADRRRPPGRAQAHRAVGTRSRPSGASATSSRSGCCATASTAIGPRPDLLGREVEPGTRTITVDPESPVLPSFITGRARPNTVVAVAVDGRIAQTTRTYGSRYAALVPPSVLHAGENTVATYEVEPSGELRLVDGDVD